MRQFFTIVGAIAFFFACIVITEKYFKISAWNAITAISTLLIVVWAVFHELILTYLRRPKLELKFDIHDESFLHEIYFQLGQFNKDTWYSEGKNCLLMIVNKDKKLSRFIPQETARGVEAKVTYIYQGKAKHTYHPTNLNWSGGRGKTAISIIAGSHHFLDFLRFYNFKDYLWEKDYGGYKKSEHSPETINAGPQVCFAPWFVGDYKGIRNEFDADGTYRIHFVINGENCGPYKYVATVKWSKEKWDTPEIMIAREK